MENSKNIPLKIELSYDPTIPLLGIYPDKTIIQKDTCSQQHYFQQSRLESNLNVHSTNEWLKRIWYIYTMVYYSAIKQNNAICSSIDGPRRRRKWHPTPVFLPGECQGQGSLVGCRLWGRTESDTTEAT